MLIHERHHLSSCLASCLVSGLLTRAGFRHAFSTRLGGLDFRGDVRVESEGRLRETLGVADGDLFQTMQVHGARVVRLRADDTAAGLWKEEADGLVTERGAVAVRIADCAPILVADPASGRVAALHAGWRGLVAGVVGAGIGELTSDPETVVASIGPCIGACCFEVGEDVAEQIVLRCRDNTVSLPPRPDQAAGKVNVDLRAAVRAELRAAGVLEAQLDDVGACTRCTRDPSANPAGDPDAGWQFHSYRRDGERSGRQLATIVAR